MWRIAWLAEKLSAYQSFDLRQVAVSESRMVLN
jgi:hypothetical protein